MTNMRKPISMAMTNMRKPISNKKQSWDSPLSRKVGRLQESHLATVALSVEK